MDDYTIKVIDGKQLLLINGNVLPRQTLSVVSQNTEQSQLGMCTARIEFLCGNKSCKLTDMWIIDRDGIKDPKGKLYNLLDAFITVVPYDLELHMVAVRIDIDCKIK